METADDRRRGLLLASAAVLCFAPGAVLVRLAQPISGTTMAAARLALAGVAMGILARATGVSLLPRRGEWARLVAVGLLTAVHFGTFTLAVESTSIAHALALTYTAPVFAALGGWLLLGERLTTRQGLGALLVVASVAWFCGFAEGGRATLAGDLLALGSGAALGTYHLAGRSMRRQVPLFRYTCWIYLTAAAALLPAASTPVGVSSAAWLAVLAQGLLSTATGHTLVNAALRHAPAAQVSLVTTQEVTLGVVLGALLVGDLPSPGSVVALAPLFAGLALVLGGPGD